ncbi:hypothetical protein H257_04343 [Aphanomyces astaci]|uniref:Rab-GAP TBC domain-containing protein n=2 Tax=Aphanomyces astaci TaxID=112090 RepID=W4GVC6_APHAT|nr:hypothetical protein H257_04343 [Aphanomyces astaci]ETV83665.1 hypothetical protein H257_04343 [Aphanomyces astaci]|eukprot:XP_009827095.1 hypothetical protein H257_04343 [Aphanomyces astaci]
MARDLTFFESIAKSFEGFSQWLDAALAPSGHPSRKDVDRSKGPSHPSHMSVANERAIKKYKLDHELYVSTYPSLVPTTVDVQSNTKSASDRAMDDITVRFHRSLYVSKNADIATAHKVHHQTKELHMTNTAEYSRHLARLENRLDKCQQNSVRSRAWNSIAQANVKLSSMDILVRDFELLVRPTPDIVAKILAKLNMLHIAVASAGQNAVSLLVEELHVLEAPSSVCVSRVLVHVCAYLSTRDIAWHCLIVSKAWNAVVAANQLVSRSIRSSHVRMCFWRHAIDAHTRTRDTTNKQLAPFQSNLSPRRCSSSAPRWCFHTLLERAMLDKHNRFHRAIHADVARTTFVQAEQMYPAASSLAATVRLGTDLLATDHDVATLSALQAKLTRVLQAYCQLDPVVGYCHGMTFLGATVLTCAGYDEVASFHMFASAMQHYDMASVFTLPDLPGTKTRLHQLDNLMRLHLPSLHKCLRTHRIHPHMFASGWIMSLFLNEPSLSPASRGIIVDEFFQGGWPRMFRIYLGLLSIHADSHLVTPHASHTLRALVQLPKLLDASLQTVLDQGRNHFTLATSENALAIMAYDPTAAADISDYF